MCTAAKDPRPSYPISGISPPGPLLFPFFLTQPTPSPPHLTTPYHPIPSDSLIAVEQCSDRDFFFILYPGDLHFDRGRWVLLMACYIHSNIIQYTGSERGKIRNISLMSLVTSLLLLSWKNITTTYIHVSIYKYIHTYTLVCLLISSLICTLFGHVIII